ncbi:MAG: UDP-glucose-undecaprenyl-phosphate glucosyltransferase [Parcubacteria group bacterium GW2011_GWC2_42_6]|nr:MAG: UDP-glucose-undecaprenyl-phosphate glucosyltransferase [Parcubacteria group bacterium GW2011_GWA2_42_11]KKS68445.1 MAG: UDP-glucose-undecaprenyl-phosphate glucosyltransferase [Parcubacteria group bacterium GW2011_GWC2_42_6]KKT76522.1 MAG: UDP-glucose-undecaprenyl-phosphate glucosyltransferase [Parcubacteria group bacterium GW2011_GWF2_44_7]
MENQPYLSVIIPTRNEEKTIGKTLLSVDGYLAKQSYSYEIIVLDNNSADKTAAVVEGYQKTMLSLRLEKKNGKGKGEAVKNAMAIAQGQYRLFMDADNATTIDHVEKMLPFFEQGYEVIIGTRDSRDNKLAKQAVPQPLYKRLFGDLGNILIQVLVLWGIWDTQCGFKAFSAKAAETIFPKVTMYKWSFDIEVLGMAKKLGYRIGIIPVYWINNPDSRVSMGAYIGVLLDVFKIKWNLITDKYGIRKGK